MNSVFTQTHPENRSPLLLRLLSVLLACLVCGFLEHRIGLEGFDLQPDREVRSLVRFTAVSERRKVR